MVMNMNNRKSVSVLVVIGLISVLILATDSVSACHYVVGTYESDYTTQKGSFFKGETIYGRGNAYGYNYPLKLRIKDPSDNIVYYSGESTSVVYGSFFLNESAPVGIWSIQLGAYYSGKWQWSTTSDRMAYFSVTDANFTLTVNINGNGSIVVDPDLDYYPFGTNVNLTAVPDSGWSFDTWGGDIISSNNLESIIMDSNKSVNANFIQNQYVLNVSVIGNGTVTKEPDQSFYVYGDIVNLTCAAETGWIFDHWEESISGNENPALITIDDNKDVTAVFIESLYSLIVNIEGNGSVNKTPDQENYTYGISVELNATPTSGWIFDHWSGSLSGNTNPVTIIITENKNITAHFMLSNSGGGGSNGGGGGGGNGGTTRNTNKPPVANLSAGAPYIGFIEEEIEFNGSLSYDPDGYIVKYEWIFGDGQTGNGRVTTHIYLMPGEYEVELKVTDNRGGTDTDKTTAIIVVPNHAPSVPVIIGPTEGMVDISYSFSVFSIDEDQDEIRYTIDWGDEEIIQSNYMSSGVLFNTTHKWLKPGQYKIIVTADDGKTDSTEDLTILIQEPDEPVITESNNFILILLALLALLFLLLFLLLAKKEKDEDKDKNKKKKKK